MILFHSIIKILACSMHDFSAQYPTYCPRVGVIAISRYLLRLMINNLPGSFEEPLGCLHIAVLTQHRVDQVTITIDCPIQVVPLAIHFHIGLIGVPRPTSFTSTSAAQLLSDKRSKPGLPIP